MIFVVLIQNNVTSART